MLGYIRGERYSLAVDAGNSRRHVEKFYAALDALRSFGGRILQVLTHWHWDHTFGLHAVDGAAIACEATNEVPAMQGFTLEVERRSHAGTHCGRVKKLNSVTSISVPRYPDRKEISVVPAGLVASWTPVR